jgi:hypothetical protein
LQLAPAKKQNELSQATDDYLGLCFFFCSQLNDLEGTYCIVCFFQGGKVKLKNVSWAIASLALKRSKGDFSYFDQTPIP